MLEFTFPVAYVYFGSYLHVYWYAVVYVPPYSCLLSISGENYFPEFNCMYQAAWWKDFLLYLDMWIEWCGYINIALCFVVCFFISLWMGAHVGVGHSGLRGSRAGGCGGCRAAVLAWRRNMMMRGVAWGTNHLHRVAVLAWRMSSC